LADEMQRTTNFSNEMVESAAAVGLQMSLTGEQIERLIPVAADLATTTGRSLEYTLNRIVYSARQGGTGLERYGIALSDVEKETLKAANQQERLALIAEMVGQRVGGQAEAMADPMVMLRNATDDLTKAFGEELLPSVYQATRALADFASSPGVLQFVRTLGRFAMNLGRAFFEVGRVMFETARVLVALDGIMGRMASNEGGPSRLQRRIAREVQTFATLVNVVLLAKLAYLGLLSAMRQLEIFLLQSVGRGTQKQQEWLLETRLAMADVKDQIDQNRQAGARYLEGLEEQSGAAADLQAILDDLAKSLEDTASGLGKTGAEADAAATFMDRLARRVIEARQALDDLRGADFFTALAMTQAAQEMERQIHARLRRLEDPLGSGMAGRGPEGVGGGGLRSLDEMLLFDDAWFDNLDQAQERLRETQEALEKTGRVAAQLEQVRDLQYAFQDMADGMSDLAGRGAGAYKAIAIAEATIATYLAASKALGQGGPTGVAQAATMVGIGMKYVGAIRRISVPGGGGGGVSGGSPVTAGHMGATPNSQAQPVHVNTQNSVNLGGEMVLDYDALRIRLSERDRLSGKGGGKR
jgi:hypothetical protein